MAKAKTLNEVLSHAIEVTKPNFTVYFLLKNKEVVYVGQSENITARVSAHFRDKDFDSYSYFEVESRDQALLEEAENILKFNPVLNNELNEKYRSISSVKIQLKREGVKGKIQFIRSISGFIERLDISLVNFRGNSFIKETDFNYVVDEIVKEYLGDPQ